MTKGGGKMKVRDMSVYNAMLERKRIQSEIKNFTPLIEKERKRLEEVRYKATWKTYKTFESAPKCKKLDHFKEGGNDG
jgi:hypothetical protein